MESLLSRTIAPVVLFLVALPVLSNEPPITLEVDASDITGKIVHAKLRIPAQPGPLTLYYPKWIPGTHGPSGPIAAIGNLHISAKGQPLAWRRQPGDMYALHCTVPDEAEAVEVAMDYLCPVQPNGEDIAAAVATTPHLAVVNWNAVVLYLAGARMQDVTVEARLRIPEGWKQATALPVERLDAEGIRFRPASLETLVDSPVLMGEHFRTIPLSDAGEAPVFLDIAADSPESLEVDEERIRQARQLVKEAKALFGSQPFRSYRFLLVDSEGLSVGLEHHECSLNSAGSRQLRGDGDPLVKMFTSLLISHEFSHSWCGKYRRPAGHVTTDYQQALNNDLLWVYEGLDEYLGLVLEVRSGLTTYSQQQDRIARDANDLENTPGRRWRPLSDVATASETLYSGRDWWSVRRNLDYYGEGALIWLEADTIIRQRSGGRRSLDDFCRAFFGGANGRPEVSPFTFEDVVATLNAVQPYDWKAFFNTRLESKDAHAPMGGLTNAGWTLAQTEKPSDYQQAVEKQNGVRMPGLGLWFSKEKPGSLIEVLPDSPAARAGLSPGMEILAVDGKRFTPEAFTAALKAAARRTEPMEVVAANGDLVRTFRVDYHAGPQYPYLKRDESKPDMLADILKPLAGAPARAGAPRPKPEPGPSIASARPPEPVASPM